MAAIPDYVGNALQFNRSSRDAERVQDAQIQSYLYQLTQQKQQDQVTRQGQTALLKALSPDVTMPLTAPPAPPSDAGGATTSPYMPQPPIQAQSMPTPAPGQSSQPMMPPRGGGAPNPASLLGPKGQAYLGAQPPNAQPAALQVLLASLMGKGATARAPAPPAAPAQGPSPTAGTAPAPTSNAATGGWQASPMAGPALGGKPPAPTGAPGGNELGAPPTLPGGQAIDPAKMPSIPQLIARMEKAGVDPQAQFAALQAYTKIEDTESKKALEFARVKAEIARAGAEASRAKAEELRAQSLAGGKATKPTSFEQEAGDLYGVGTPEYKAAISKHLAHETAPTAAQATIGGISSVVPEKDQNKNGEDYLSTLSPSIANEIKGIDEGRVNIKSLPYRGNARQDFLEMVSQYDPSFDESKAPARVSTRRDFASGQAARNITAINTAIGHLGTMDELAGALGTGDIRAVNSAVNRVATELGQPQVNSFELAKNAVSDELMRVFRQVGASDTEAARWEKTFQAASSPQQLKAAMKTAVSLLGSRAQALNDQWINTMGTVAKAPEVIHSHSMQVLRKMGIPDPLGGTESTPTYTPSQLRQAIKDKKVKAGDTFLDPDGNPHRVN